ncbi:MAG: hypothetical protein EPN48_12435 [Microbacteriaceae bacterium]|nr:MAG: hypothetical protein EPN48_12435 [Microbacteriaceae bacterium]
MKRTIGVAGVALAALVLTGCAPQAIAPIGTPITTFPDGTTKTPRSTPADGLDDGPSAPTPPAADSTSQAAAVKLAEKFMTAFARPQLDATSWMNALYPMLTQQGAAAYEGTDPSNVPVHRVSGSGTVVDGATDYALVVTVPTDIGTYAVSVTRKAPTDPWLVDRITPPGR